MKPQICLARVFTLTALVLQLGVGASQAWTSISTHLEIEVDPATHRIEGQAELTFESSNAQEALRLALHPALSIDSVVDAASGETLSLQSIEPGDAQVSPLSPAIYEIMGSAPTPEPRKAERVLLVRFHGLLRQDVSAGEQPGQIHNFEMQAHVGPEGIYLEADAYWYPRLPAAPAGVNPPLFQHRLRVEAPRDLTLVASGQRQEGNSWTTPLPLPGMTLVGGPHQVFERQVGEVLVRAHLSPDSASFAPALLDATQEYLELFQPLLGPYPYDEFTIVENFFSSGFAFPGFTLLAQAVIRMGESSLRPGYLDHELLHSWWGNGVYVSHEDGNWCEALATFCGNYMRPVLEGDEEAGRTFRRNTIESASRMTEERIGPLGDFQRDGATAEVGRFQGYQMGAMVFHELQRQLGQDTMWKGLRRFYTEHQGRYAGWAELEAAFEAESRRNLDSFFEYWVRGSQLPQVEVAEANAFEGAIELQLEVDFRLPEGTPTSQAPPYRLPVLLQEGDKTLADTQVRVAPGSYPLRWNLPLEVDPGQLKLEVDRDYQAFRRLRPELLMPTLSALGLPQRLTLVRSSEEMEGTRAAYDPVAEAFERRYARSKDDLHKVDVSSLPRQLGTGDHLILGRAALHPSIQALLEDTPVEIGPSGFQVDETRYSGPADALLVCLHNSSDAESVVCIYTGNREDALRRAHLLPFYGGNSLIVFQDGNPVERRDFEGVERVEIVIEAPQK